MLLLDKNDLLLKHDGVHMFLWMKEGVRNRGVKRRNYVEREEGDERNSSSFSQVQDGGLLL